MEASVSSRASALPITTNLASLAAAAGHKSTRAAGVAFRHAKRNNRLIGTRRSVSPIEDVPTVLDPVQADITWQIVVGAIAGVTPFVVAGIEFSKRIIQQKNCAVCGGSGLVLRDKKYYFRCPSCGGFLPWQSWKRFFSG